jgi:hypothetical protein
LIGAEQIHRTLTELIVLTSGQPHLSEYLRELRQACETEQEKVQAMVSDFRLWGGPGSVADQAGIDLLPDGQQRVYELLIQLYEQLEANGITDARGASWVDTFRHWSNSAAVGSEES